MIMMQVNCILKNLNQLINKLSDLVQILPFYYNYKGEKIEIPSEIKAEILSSMGIEITEDSLNYWIEYFEQNAWKNLSKSVYVTGEHPQIFIYGEETLQNFLEIQITPYEELGCKGEKVVFTIDINQSNITESKIFNDKAYHKYVLSILQLPIGYYNLKFISNQRESNSFLIVTPAESFTLFPNKTWGFHLNLWSLRGRNIEGDFSHLREFAQYVYNLGGFVSINPLHFNDPQDPYGISPYSALSRQFKTPLYISDIPIEEKNKDFFEYREIWIEKLQKLKKKYYSLHDGSKEINEFQSFKNNLPKLLKDDLEYFAAFCFLREKLGKDWLSWGEKFKNPDKNTIDSIYRENSKEVSFYEYLQWLVEKELEGLKKYNLCLDLGFGSIKNSFDVWINRELYALSAENGAPPDDFNPKGQKWGFPPLVPFRLKEQGYIPFIKVLRANMKGNLLRIDHALGLFRAFWIPQGKSPSEGAYIRYPWKDLLQIICLESQLNKTALIGEDLGTAEEWMRHELIKRKISSWRVFYFEKDFSGFRDSSEYPEEALCSITTHDLPTFKGFWLGRDIELRREFAIFDDSLFNQARKERIKDKERILHLLAKYEKKEEGENLESLLLLIIKFLSETKSRYLLLYPEDILLMEEQTNLPGTTNEYPNWRRKIPLELCEFFELETLKKIEAILKESGRIQRNP